ncbi:hypothetical protein KHQ81_15645 (plasmid) [Mycoplasmatota bacterium]|nr:hypothetical protein KHQ81_15645 [Mycoplasmatota bacterium]
MHGGFYKELPNVVIIDGLEYTKSNSRLRYNAEYHENYKNHWTTEELCYMCSMWDSRKKADIALALGRTHGSVLTMAYQLRKKGKFEYYKKLGKQM